MKKHERIAAKYLTSMEKDLLVKFDRWLNTVFASLPSLIVTTQEDILRWHLPFPSQLARILNEHDKEVLFAWLAHADAECKKKQRR